MTTERCASLKLFDYEDALDYWQRSSLFDKEQNF